MEITWYGHSCFRLSERGKAVVITDPFDNSIGYKQPNLKADIVTISHYAPGHGHFDAVKGYNRVIDRPGEYEIGGVFVIGSAMHNVAGETVKPNVAFLFDFDGLTVAHLGDLNHVPNQSMIESLGSVNIALVPVGGGGGLTPVQAAEVVGLLEPNIVIPMHYKTDQTTLELEPVDGFLKEIGASRVQQEPVFKIASSSLPEQMQIVVLELGR
jgi:L-ascorbate metabolism protein UlaG (beta-lactamase superfamily)